MASAPSGSRKSRCIMPLASYRSRKSPIDSFDQAKIFVDFVHRHGWLTYGPPEHREGFKGMSHAAIYLGQDEHGIRVFDQGIQNSPRVHQIRFDKAGWEGETRYYTVVATR